MIAGDFFIEDDDFYINKSSDGDVVDAMKIVFVMIVTAMLHMQVCSEAFGNSSVTIPKIGMVLFDDVLSPKRPWGIDHQWSIGTSFMQALDYRWWWVVDTSFAMGQLKLKSQDYLAAFTGGVGVRYNIFLDDFRPHTGMMVHYLQFIGAGAKKLPLNLDWPIFVGLKPYFGMEWLFYSEMSLLVEGAYGLYVNINEPFRHVLYANSSFSIYF